MASLRNSVVPSSPHIGPTGGFTYPTNASVPRTADNLTFEGLDADIPDIPKYCTEICSRLEKLDAKGSVALIYALETSSKMSHLLKGVSDRSGRQSDSFSAESKAALASIQKQVLDLFAHYQLVENKAKELELLRSELSYRIASQQTIEKIAAARHTPKLIGPNSGGIVSVNSRQLSNVSNMSTNSSGSSIDMASFLAKGPRAASENAPAPAPPKNFSKLPKEIVDANLPKPEIMRLSTLYELIETEADYCRDLTTMMTFYRPLLRESKMVYEPDVITIFSNVEQLLVVNQAMLAKFYTRRDQNIFIVEIGDIIAECSESLKVYTAYAANYPLAMKIVHTLQQRPESKETLSKWMNLPEARGLSLESFLIKPVQRICKYPLLLRELEKFNEKAGNTKDTAGLRLAAEKIEAVVMAVNEATRVAEERQRILNLEGQIDSPMVFNFAEKKHLKDGPVQRMVAGKPKDRHVILFTDMLILCKPSKTGVTKYELEGAYSLAELILQKADAKDTVRAKTNTINLNIITSEDHEVISLAPNTDADKVKWLDIFMLAFKDITEEHRSAVRSSMNLRQPASENTFASLRGGPMSMKLRNPKGNRGISTIATPSHLRKVAARKTMLDNFGGPNSSDVIEPDLVDIGGLPYKKALAATGYTYYFCIQTKQAIWILPETCTLYDPNGVKSSTSSDPSSPGPNALLLSEGSRGSLLQEEESSPATDETVGLELVDGFPDWRKVDRGDNQPYYFNINTKETRWDPPEEGC